MDIKIANRMPSQEIVKMPHCHKTVLPLTKKMFNTEVNKINGKTGFNPLKIIFKGILETR